MHILHVVGARPNLMKVAPVLSALKHYSKIKQTLIHTGQHYDTNMSDVFFQQLGNSGARRQPWSRFREPCTSNCGNHDSLRAHRFGAQTGRGIGLWRCQLDGGGRAGLLKTIDSGGPRRGGASIRRPDDAGRN